MTTVLYMPDGNRRYAEKKKIPLGKAYDLGGETLKLFSQFFLVDGRSEMLLYHALSSYTHQRTDHSLDSIFEAATKTLEGLIQDDFFKSNEIQFSVIDHSGNLPESLKKSVEHLTNSTKGFKEKKVVVLLGYSLEADYNQALLQKPNDYRSLREKLIFSKDIDLVIRPGEMRLSEGPIYAMPQAQMITLDKLNPDVSREDLDLIWQKYLELKDYRKKGNPTHHK